MNLIVVYRYTDTVSTSHNTLPLLRLILFTFGALTCNIYSLHTTFRTAMNFIRLRAPEVAINIRH